MSKVQEAPLTETAFLVLLAMYTPNHGYGVMQFVEEKTNGRVVFKGSADGSKVYKNRPACFNRNPLDACSFSHFFRPSTGLINKRNFLIPVPLPRHLWRSAESP